MLKGKKEIYGFGPFRLDVSEHRLERDDGGEVAYLPEKAFQTLVVLVRNAGSLVAKEQLLNEVWPDTIVEENNLDKCIYTIRHSLGDSPSQHQYVETVRKHGYRFNAEVRTVDQANDGTGMDARLPEACGKDSVDTVGASTSDPARMRKAADLSRRPKEIRIVPSVQDMGHGRQNEPVISTATTESGAFVISAKWRPPGNLPSQPVPATKERSHAARRVAVVVLLVIIGVAAALAFYYYLTAGVKIFGPKSIAILPFNPIDSSNRDELYEIGIADSPLQRMGGLATFVVRPLGATRKYADLQQDPVTAGKEQQVNYVLSASYQLSDGKVRVTAQLINVATGQVEETLKSESGVSDVFAMQDAVADQIARALLTRLASASGTQRVWRGTANEEAYRLYLQGMYFYSKRTLAASKTAVELLDRAVRLDPNYALAWAGKAHAHRYAGNLGRDTDTHGEYRKSIEAINTALSLNKDLSEAHSALCENKYYYEFDFAGAETECKRAITIDPNSSLAHEIYGRFLYHRGRFNEGIVEINAAVDLEPASLFNQRNLGIAYYYSGRYEEAEAQLKRVIAMDQSFASAYMWLRNSLEMQQKYAEAYEWFIKAQKVLGTDESVVRRYQTAYMESGYPGMMREHAKFADTYNQYYIGGILNAQTGNKDKAFEYLEKSYQRREWGMNSLLIEPQLEPLRSDPRFRELVAKVGLN